MRYYAFVAGNVSGPFQPAELQSLLQPELLVCVEGADAWVKAGELPELSALMALPAPVSAPPGGIAAKAPPGVVAGSEAPPRDLAPKLRELWVICRNASDELLREQKTKHWKKFFKTEQEIIAAEFKRRGLH